MINIYIVKHKKSWSPSMDGFVPIQVGAFQSKDKICEVTDATKENISSKNASYCELTALYWMWKNDKSEYLGLVHYRRYFYRHKLNFKSKNVASPEYLYHLLKEYDMVLPKKTVMLKKNVCENYADRHNKSDLMVCREIISMSCPEYIEAFDKTLESHKYYPFNMVVTSKKLFDAYCSWLFNILELAEKRIDISKYDNYNKRVFGFLAERLFNVWINYNCSISIKELPVYNCEDKMEMQYLKRVLDDLKGILLR
ncbi:MAG: DUF4422 domain-containing protein [[Eubacterium] rectale]|nr:DUF4422 domain-containing protein [Agathobacter rectalis]